MEYGCHLDEIVNMVKTVKLKRRTTNPVDKMHDLTNQLIDQGRFDDARTAAEVASLMSKDRSIDVEILGLELLMGFWIVVLALYIVGTVVGWD
jgi:hypothetical protein